MKAQKVRRTRTARGKLGDSPHVRIKLRTRRRPRWRRCAGFDLAKVTANGLDIDLQVPRFHASRRPDSTIPGWSGIVPWKSPILPAHHRSNRALYAIEQEIRGRPPHERCAVRQEHSRPLLAIMKAWLEQTLQTLSQKSATAKAIRYLGRWEALGRYYDDGRIEIDNNAAERALRCVALGRKNYLFDGSDAGGERAAAMYRLLAAPSSTATIPKRFSARCSRGSPIIQ